jgi:uncharacterized protein YoaH (UPF0181 family)
MKERIKHNEQTKEKGQKSVKKMKEIMKKGMKE